MGWDEIDSIKAQIRGWSARTIQDTPFRHHRMEGIRDGSQRKRWHEEGKTGHYMGYRFSYLVARALWRARRQPAALALISGYVTAVLRQSRGLPIRASLLTCAMNSEHAGSRFACASHLGV